MPELRDYPSKALVGDGPKIIQYVGGQCHLTNVNLMGRFCVITFIYIYICYILYPHRVVRKIVKWGRIMYINTNRIYFEY